MKYKNTKTGVVIDTPCKISGGDWIELEKQEFVDEINETPEKTSTVKSSATDDDAFNGITIKQIKQELDAFGIKYDPKAKKQELYDLMMQGK